MLRSYRLGFATNSSSSHSIIIHPALQAAQRYTPATPWSTKEELNHPSHYSLITTKDKAGYLAHLAERQIRFNTELTAHQKANIHGAFHRAGFSMAELLAHTPNIEYDSVLGGCPKGVPFDLWLSFLLDPCVSMHCTPESGDDERVYEPCLEVGHAKLPYSLSDFTRWKIEGDAMVSFDIFTGSKFRWSASPYEKAITPELVDVKITDWCGFGCTFCYQGSTTEGVHAPLDAILAIFDQLADMGVFEVALGGGEPLAHPDIVAIIDGAKSRGLCVALTTFDKKLLDHPHLTTLLDSKHNHPGRLTALGVSVHGHKDVERLVATKEGLRARKLYTELIAQTVVGATPLITLERTLDVAIERDMPLLLLGYKTTGRGAGRERPVNTETLKRLLVKAKNARSMPDILTSEGGFRLGVDTAFLDSYGDLLDSIGIPSLLRSSPEGKFSMYVDAVTGTCGPSSYCEPESMEPIGDLRAQFATY